jgi:hypothetical protein
MKYGMYVYGMYEYTYNCFFKIAIPKYFDVVEIGSYVGPTNLTKST